MTTPSSLGSSMKLRRVTGLAVLVLVVSVCGSAATATATAATRPATAPLSIDPGFSNDLVAVSADSATDVWTVGNYQRKHRLYTLVERWDGTSWRQVKAPTPPGKLGGQLAGVSALSPTDVWAVGSVSEDHRFKTWVLHWNGRTWRRVPSPNPSPGRAPSGLASVTALSARDVWAVGGYISGTPPRNRPLVEHWNGTKWRVVPTPDLHAHGGGLSSVSAQSAKDVWAAGVFYPGASVDVLMEHWDGHHWTQWTAPSGAGQNWVNSVSVDSPRDAWVAGWVYNGADKIDRPVIDHWDGSSWQRIQAPNAGARFGGFQVSGVSAVSPNDAWVVGTSAGARTFHTVTEHWDGARWSVVPAAHLGPGKSSIFGGVSAVGSGHVFAVGSVVDGTKVLTLAETWDGTHWQQF